MALGLKNGRLTGIFKTLDRPPYPWYNKIRKVEIMRVPETPKKRVAQNPCFQIRARNPFSRDRKNMWMPAPMTTELFRRGREVTHRETKNTRSS